MDKTFIKNELWARAWIHPLSYIIENPESFPSETKEPGWDAIYFTSSLQVKNVFLASTWHSCMILWLWVYAQGPLYVLLCGVQTEVTALVFPRVLSPAATVLTAPQLLIWRVYEPVPSERKKGSYRTCCLNAVFSMNRFVLNLLIRLLLPHTLSLLSFPGKKITHISGIRSSLVSVVTILPKRIGKGYSISGRGEHS